MNENKRGAMLGFGSKLWAMAEKLRGYMDAARSHTWSGMFLLNLSGDVYANVTCGRHRGDKKTCT